MPVTKEATPQYFNNIIRLIKRQPLDLVRELYCVSFSKLKAMKQRSKADQAVSGVPNGSDQVNIGDFVYWVNRIGSGDRKAIRQLQQIDATAGRRLVGW